MFNVVLYVQEINSAYFYTNSESCIFLCEKIIQKILYNEIDFTPRNVKQYLNVMFYLTMYFVSTTQNQIK